MPILFYFYDDYDFFFFFVFFCSFLFVILFLLTVVLINVFVYFIVSNRNLSYGNREEVALCTSSYWNSGKLIYELY